MASQSIGTLYADVEVRLNKLDSGLAQAESKMQATAGRMRQKTKFIDFGEGTGNLKPPVVKPEVRNEKLDAGLAQAEAKVKRSAERMKQKSRFDFGGPMVGGSVAGVAVFAGFDAAAKAATAGIALFKGETEQAREAIFSLPLGIGQAARSIDGLLDAIEGPLDEIDARIEKQQAMQKQLVDDLKAGGISRRSALQREADTVGLEGADLARARVEQEAKRRTAEMLKARKAAFGGGVDMRQEFQAEAELIERIRVESLEKIDREEQRKEDERRRREEEAAARDAERELRDAQRLEKELMDAEKRRAKEMKADAFIPRSEGFSATQLALNLPGLGRQDPPTGRGQQEQTGVLRDMLAAITRLNTKATAA